MGVIAEPTKGKVGLLCGVGLTGTEIKMPDSESNAEKGIGSNGAASNGSNAEKPEPTETQKQQPQGLSQSSKDDIGVCVVIISITILAIIITIIKIVLFDISAYPELFSSGSSS